MRRRQFIAGLGSAVAWPLATRAQQADRIRRVGALMGWDENDPEAKDYFSRFTQGLVELGWTDDRNLQTAVRWAAGNVERAHKFAKELVNLQPDVILAHSTPVTEALQRETPTIPIVFVTVVDPVGEGFVAGLAHPGGNMTGFINMEAAMASKWMELLIEIAPSVKRIAAMFNPDTAPYVKSYWPAFEAAARTLNVAPIAAPIRSDAEIESVVTSLARDPRGGFVAMADIFTTSHRGRIILLAAENNVPAVYSTSAFVREGALLPTEPIMEIYSVALPHMWIAFSVARSRRSFPFRCRPNSR